jgi:hypothetical protein
VLLGEVVRILAQRRRAVARAVVVAAIAIAAEGFSYLALSVPARALQKRLYWPPTITPAESAIYLARRDPRLGWPSRDWLADNADSMGARRSPENERLADQPPCVSTYGDSFTFGSDVADEQAWTNVLAQRLGCRVTNFGVPGYGVDQSVLRFEGNHEHHTPVVILGFYTLDMDRNLTRPSGTT